MRRVPYRPLAAEVYRVKPYVEQGDVPGWLTKRTVPRRRTRRLHAERSGRSGVSLIQVPGVKPENARQAVIFLFPHSNGLPTGAPANLCRAGAPEFCVEDGGSGLSKMGAQY